MFLRPNVLRIFLGLLCVLCSPIFSFSLDREAFSITNYDLTLQIDPDQHRLGARGKVTLRNDSSSPQKTAVLQISSSLDWRSIRAGNQAVQFVRQLYTSDIDHTGTLSEAIVTLPRAIDRGATTELEIAYEGVVLLDATRLTRIGTPEDVAKDTDWDRIDTNFTALRGIGYVTWYPIATEAANLSEGDNLFAVLERWKQREFGSTMDVELQNSIVAGDERPLLVVCSGRGNQSAHEGHSGNCKFDAVARTPALALADFGMVDRSQVTVFNLQGDAAAAETYAAAAQKISPLIIDWFGPQHNKLRIIDMPNPQAARFESGPLLFTPLTNSDVAGIGLAVAHQLTHASLLSSRAWIEEGLAHFSQALFLERDNSRQAALKYMDLHRTSFVQAELLPPTDPSKDGALGSLIHPVNESYRAKAMYVWWMLRDMLGDEALKKVLYAYHADQDDDPSYVQHLFAAQSQRDLQWFFDDWVYHDRGLPEFKIESAFASKTGRGGFLSTITVDNLGGAGAEVPLIIKFTGGEVTKRLEVRARSKAVIRVETSSAPQEIVVNDGSVPESDLTNNTFKVDAPRG